MTTHLSTHNPVRSDVAPTGVSTSDSATARSRGWALAGIGAGLAGVGTIVTSSMISAVYEPELQGDAAAITERLTDQAPIMFAFHTITAVGALLMVVFAAGLFRRLRAAVGPDSAVPVVALAGLVGTAVVSILGSGLDTEFMMALASEPEVLVPETSVMYNHWVGTIPWLWTLAGLAGLGVYAASRRGGVPRWLGRVGLVLGGLTVLLGVSPFEYMAGTTGALWLLATAIGFTVGDKAFRAR